MAPIHSLVLLCCQLLLIVASPVPGGEKLEDRSSLPIINLPYASYQAASYAITDDIYTFKNIRFAAPPVGDLRWAKPAPPLNETGIQDGSIGNHCVQSAPNGLNLLGSGNQSPVGAALNQFLAGIPVPSFSGGAEDCLFLDVYVPGQAIKDPSMKLPVVVWFFGGGFLFGSKDSMTPKLPFYDGSGLIREANNGMIFVSINYRLGALGFLAGSTMESQGLPNAGLWDQRAALQWVQDHISLFGGDPSQVTAMGESAGAGSIMHHLVAQGGKLDPLFKKAILMSPAFEYIWDRAGTVQNTFESFAGLAGCGSNMSVACLRSADSSTLINANTELMKQQYSGVSTFAVGPTPDGSCCAPEDDRMLTSHQVIRQLPVLELSTGNFWDIDSLIVSHVENESGLFVSGSVQTNDEFSQLVDQIFPNYTQTAGITDKITSFYPPVASGSVYSTQTDRVQAFVRDSSFTCNTRHLTEGVGDSKVWNMQYGVSPGWHGTDLLPAFFNTAFTVNSLLEDLAELIVPVIGPLIAGISAAMQSYFASYVVTGDPNTHRKILNIPPTVKWNHPDSSGEQMSGVVNFGDLGITTISDSQNQKTPCDFWREVAAAVTSLGGYSPPGAVLSQDLVAVTGDTSRNYIGGNNP